MTIGQLFCRNIFLEYYMALRTKAISEEQKAIRRSVIIRSARELFEKSDFHEISMREIARRAGMAKGTVFFYFKTKEELFLACVREELGRWHDRFDAMLREYQKTHKPADFDVDELVEIMVKSLDENNTFSRFISIVEVVLNHNIDFDEMLAHKKFVLARAVPTGKLLEEIIPYFKPSDGIKLYNYAFFITAGLYPAAEPSETTRKVFTKPGMEFFNIDFFETFREIMGTVLRGWK